MIKDAKKERLESLLSSLEVIRTNIFNLKEENPDLKMRYPVTVSGILDAYRECDLSFAKAEKEILKLSSAKKVNTRLIHQVIADLDQEKKYMIKGRSVSTIGGHILMIYTLNKFCKSIGNPYLSFIEEEPEKDDKSRIIREIGFLVGYRGTEKEINKRLSDIVGYETELSLPEEDNTTDINFITNLGQVGDAYLSFNLCVVKTRDRRKGKSVYYITEVQFIG